MRTLLTLSILALSAPAFAQANDWAGISVSSTGVSSTPNSARDISCGSSFSCQPLPLAGSRGDDVNYFVMGTFNGFYALVASFDTANLGCLPLGLPSLANNLILTPGAMETLAVGICTVPDNGRCNGGASPSTLLGTIPTTIAPGSIAFQAVVQAPTAGGGTILALSRAVELTFN